MSLILLFLLLMVERIVKAKPNIVVGAWYNQSSHSLQHISIGQMIMSAAFYNTLARSVMVTRTPTDTFSYA